MDFLSKAGLSACKPEQDLKLASDAGELLDDPSTYRRLVGSFSTLLIIAQTLLTLTT